MRAAAVILTIWLAGCAGAPAPPTPTPARTDAQTAVAPGGDAIEELTERLISGMAAEPPGWPSRSDYELVALPFYHDRPDFVDEALAEFGHYAAVYTASECLAGRETTPSGFRELVGETFSADRDRHTKIAAAAEVVVADILDRAADDAPPCLRYYTSPGTAVDAIGAIRLARPVVTVNRPGLPPWEVDAELRMIALSWFGRGEPFFEWVCAHEDVCKVSPQRARR